MRHNNDIETFIRRHGVGDCSLLKSLYRLDAKLSDTKLNGLPELTLIDPPGPYGGTILYRPALTPSNCVTFAMTGGDDVHFSLVKVGKGYGDDSPVVMTVPMADDTPEETNIILSSNLKDFLQLGCIHGFFDLEQLLYDREGTIERYSQPEHEEDPYLYDEEDDKAFKMFRSELGLEPIIKSLESSFSQLKFRWYWIRRLGLG
jgi:hypothetical protein